MSKPDRDDVTISEGDVTVQRVVDEDRFETLAVVYKIDSARSNPVQVTLTQAFPESIPIENVGFHPEYGPEHWRIEDQAAIFERTFDMEEEYITAFGILDLSAEKATDAMDIPSIELKTNVSEEPGVTTKARNAAEWLDELAGNLSPGDTKTGKMLRGGNAQTQPNVRSPDSDLEPDAKQTHAGESGNLSEHEEPVHTRSEPSSESQPETDKEPEQPQTMTSAEKLDPNAETGGEWEEFNSVGLFSALAEEFRKGNVSAADRKLIKKELGLNKARNEARIKHLQNRVSDLEAYTAALEIFLDPNGGGQKIIDELQSNLDSLGNDLDRLEADIADNTESLTLIQDDVSDLGDRLQSVNKTAESLEEDIIHLDNLTEELQADVDTLEPLTNRTDELEEELRGIRSRISELDDFHDRFTSALQGNVEETE